MPRITWGVLPWSIVILSWNILVTKILHLKVTNQFYSTLINRNGFVQMEYRLAITVLLSMILILVDRGMKI